MRQEASTAERVGVIDSNPCVLAALYHGHAVVSGQHRIDKGIFAVQDVEQRAVVAEEIVHKAHGLLEHGLAQFVGETGEAFAVDGIVFFEAAEIEPVAGEFGGEPRAASSLSMRCACAVRTSGFCRSPAAARASSSSSGMLDHRK